MVAWYEVNNFNFQADIERANPPDFTPSNCVKCSRLMKLGAESHAYTPTGGYICDACSGH